MYTEPDAQVGKDKNRNGKRDTVKLLATECGISYSLPASEAVKKEINSLMLLKNQKFAGWEGWLAPLLEWNLMVGKGGLPPLRLNGIQQRGQSQPSQPANFSH